VLLSPLTFDIYVVYSVWKYFWWVGLVCGVQTETYANSLISLPLATEKQRQLDKL